MSVTSVGAVPLPDLRDIGVEDCMPIRHRVLGPDRPLEQLRVFGDEQARHLGIFVTGRLVGCLSLFSLVDGLIQLRKFAVLPEWQGKGLGSFALTHVVALCRDAGCPELVLDARRTATGFYERHGFSGRGQPFYKGQIPYLRMERNLR